MNDKLKHEMKQDFQIKVCMWCIIGIIIAILIFKLIQ